jgi:hypothetical protein
MKFASIRLIAVFAVVTLASASVALAKHNGGKSGNHGHGGFKLSFGGNSHHHNKFHHFKHHNLHHHGHHHRHHWHHYHKPYYVKPVYVPTYVETCPIVIHECDPFHCSYVVLPGDSFHTVSLKEYGSHSNAVYIAQFNNMPLDAALVPGQTLMLPSISASGALSPSHAPVAGPLPSQPLSGPAPISTQLPPANVVASAAPVASGKAVGSAKSIASRGGAPISGSVAPASGASAIASPSPSPGSAPNGVPAVKGAAPAAAAGRLKVAPGSMLMLNGQSLGDKPGIARLRIGAVTLKIEIARWTGSSVQIRMPQLELAGPTMADIEILRADGSPATKSAIELVAATELALAK